MVDESEGTYLLEGIEPPQQLLVRLTEDVGKLPAQLVYRLPPAIAEALVRHRKATPIANMGAFPDLDVSEAELEVAGLDWSVIQS
jgi:hypothetical protein